MKKKQGLNLSKIVQKAKRYFTISGRTGLMSMEDSTLRFTRPELQALRDRADLLVKSMAMFQSERNFHYGNATYRMCLEGLVRSADTLDALLARDELMFKKMDEERASRQKKKRKRKGK